LKYWVFSTKSEKKSFSEEKLPKGKLKITLISKSSIELMKLMKKVNEEKKLNELSPHSKETKIMYKKLLKDMNVG
jgi:hypothetical protein